MSGRKIDAITVEGLGKMYRLASRKRPERTLREAVTSKFAGDGDKVTYEELIHGAIEHMAEIDGHIRTLAHNWEFDRIARIDLAILRLAIYEMIYRKDIPPVVSINEAINLSKQFSNADAKRFINGILDRLKSQLGRDARKAE